jgi:hypothetical protein
MLCWVLQWVWVVESEETYSASWLAAQVLGGTQADNGSESENGELHDDRLCRFVGGNVIEGW